MVAVLAETYLLYSSLTLFTISCLTLVLSIFFRLKYHRIDSLPKNLSANVFNKTFNVFNPYPKHRKVIHNFLSVFPLIAIFGGLISIVLVEKILEYGLLSSLLILIICLNLMLVDFASDIYQNAKNFIKAVHDKTGLGVGDLEVFQNLKRSMPKLSNYYLALSVLFLTLGLALNYIWSSLLWFFTDFIRLLFEVWAITGPWGPWIVVLLFALTVVIIQIFAWKIKNKVLSHIMGSSSLESARELDKATKTNN